MKASSRRRGGRLDLTLIRSDPNVAESNARDRVGVPDASWQIEGVADFDGNAKADILWRHAVTGLVAIWFMDGSQIASLGYPGTVDDLNWQIQT